MLPTTHLRAASVVQVGSSASWASRRRRRLLTRRRLGRRAAAAFMSTSILVSMLVHKSLARQIDRALSNWDRNGESERCERRYFSRVWDLVFSCRLCLGRPGPRRVTRPGVEKSSVMLQRSAVASETRVNSGTFESPASILCSCRGETLASSASCSWVAPLHSRNSMRRRPNLTTMRAASAFATSQRRDRLGHAEHVARCRNCSQPWLPLPRGH